MSLTIGPPTRVVALVGALVLTGLAAVVFLLGRGALSGGPSASSTPTSPVTIPTHVKTATPSTTPRTPHVRREKARVASGFPVRIDHALRYRDVVVVSVSMPGAAVDAIVRGEARAAAKASRAGFVAISATNETAISQLVARTGVFSSPAVVIVKRPGVVATTFSVTDAATIQQAVAEARR